ncbi:MAG: hypothetical protein IJE92_04090 [Clostridia bacterium]|nr:hypothetical protein [Clostridia bacterium]
MAKKKFDNKNPQYTRTPTTAERSDLKTDVVEKLVTADESNVPEVGAEEIKKYSSGGLAKIPSWIKALFLKFWFNGAMCFFFLWGLGNVIGGWDIILVLALASGAVTDLLLNNIFRFIEKSPKEYNKWMMFPQKKLWTLFANLGYAIVLVLLVAYTYNGINIAINGPDSDKVAVAVEPFLYGLLYLVYDLIFIGCRNLMGKIIRDAKAKNQPKPTDTTNEQ